jgi:hypothetical protein
MLISKSGMRMIERYIYCISDKKPQLLASAKAIRNHCAINTIE